MRLGAVSPIDVGRSQQVANIGAGGADLRPTPTCARAHLGAHMSLTRPCGLPGRSLASPPGRPSELPPEPFECWGLRMRWPRVHGMAVFDTPQTSNLAHLAPS